MAATNPFDAVAPGVATQTPAQAEAQPGGILDAAMANPVTASTTAPNTAAAVSGQAAGNGYTAAASNNAAATVAPQSTVAGQLNNTLDANSPLLQKAQSDAAQTANSRGLLNSSMAAGAGTSALLDKALQIATPDAQTNAQFALTNAQSQNATNTFNAGQANAAAATAAQAQNAASAQNAQLATSVSQTNTQAQNQARQFDASQNLQAQTTNQGVALNAATTKFQAGLQTALQNATEADKINVQKMVSSTQTAIEQVDAQYKTQMQTSQSSQGMYSSTMTQIGQIMASPNLDANARQNLVDQQIAALKNGLNIQMGISNIDGVASLIGDLGNNIASTNTAQPVAVPGAPPPPPPVTNSTNPNLQP